jgi:hypothetical protein
MLRLVSSVMYSFLLSKGTREYDEASSLHVMMEVMIYGSAGCEENKKPRQVWANTLPGP